MANKVIITNYTEDELKHFGVLGMKWGVRKDPDKISSKSKLSKDLPKGEPRTHADGVKRIRQELEDDRNNRVTKLKDIPRFDPKTESVGTACKKVNEGYKYDQFITSEIAKEYNLGSSRGGQHTFGNNCASTAFSYELRRRGYDVEAGITGGIGQFDLGKMFNIGTMDVLHASNNGCPPRTHEEIEQEIKNMGPGARGFCVVEWDGGRGSHVSSFEVGEDGQVVYVDAQPGITSSTARTDTQNYFVLRTDDRKINESMVSEWTRVDDRIDPKEADAAAKKETAEIERRAKETVDKRNAALSKQKTEALKTAQKKTAPVVVKMEVPKTPKDKTNIIAKVTSTTKEFVKDIAPSKIKTGKDWVTNKFKKR